MVLLSVKQFHRIGPRVFIGKQWFLDHLEQLLNPTLGSSLSLPRLFDVEFSLAREVHRKLPQDLTHLKFENKSRTTRSRFH